MLFSDLARKGTRARATAALVVHAVRDQGQSLDDALAEIDDLDDPRDHPLVRELCYEVLRTLPR